MDGFERISEYGNNLKRWFTVLTVLMLIPSTLTGCFSRSTQENSNIQVSNVNSAPVQVVEKPLTAKESYEASLVVARAWKSDAVLMSATATIPWPDQALASGKTTWAFYYKSPSTSQDMASYVVSVSNGKAEGIRQGKLTSQGSPMNQDEWKVDSPAALDVFLKNGGQSYLEKQKKADVNIRLMVPAVGTEPVWIISAFSEGSQPFLVQVEAARGTVKTGQPG